MSFFSKPWFQTNTAFTAASPSTLLSLKFENEASKWWKEGGGPQRCTEREPSQCTPLAGGINAVTNSSRVDAGASELNTTLTPLAAEEEAVAVEEALVAITQETAGLAMDAKDIEVVDALTNAAMTTETTAGVTTEVQPHDAAVPGVCGYALTQEALLGRCEIGSAFDQQQKADASRGVTLQDGDGATVVRPWDQNAATAGSQATFQSYIASKTKISSAIRVNPINKEDDHLGVLFPLEDDVVISDGVYVKTMEVEATALKDVMGKMLLTAVSVYRVRFLQDDGLQLATADVVPDFEIDGDTGLPTAHRYIATPSVGGKWPSKGGKDPKVITTDNIRDVRAGQFAPWSPQIVALIEHAMWSIQ